MTKKERAEKTWLGLIATRPMWGMIPLRILFGVILILQGLSRFGFVRIEGALINELPENVKFGFIITFAIVEIVGGALAIPGLWMRFVGLAIFLSTIVSVVLEGTFGGSIAIVNAQLLLMAIALMMLFSGAGRYSMDRYQARKLIKKYPSVKQEYYCIAETPYTKWWE